MIDAFNPLLPAELDRFGAPARASGVEVATGLACVAAGASELRVIGISDITAAEEVFRIDTPGYAHDLAVAGLLANVADGSWGLRIISFDPVDTQACVTGETLDRRPFEGCDAIYTIPAE